jgi:hypothetical protein
MTKAYLYQRTSADDRDRKAGIDVFPCNLHYLRAGQLL